MKLPALFAATVLGLAFGANAFAQATTHDLTRAEVHAQLVEAQADGLLPVPKTTIPSHGTRSCMQSSIINPLAIPHPQPRTWQPRALPPIDRA
jgi:Domain of unknown function (DUF4148)